MIPSLAGRVAAALERRLDRDSSAPLALALSGGGDSTALLALVMDWARRPVLALSVDHGLNPDGAAWNRLAEATALRLGARWRGLSWTGPKPDAGLPAAARQARHALLAEAARAAGAHVILMAHTLDDVLEGVLMREEGAQLGSLRDWSPSPVWPEGRDIFLARPLLNIRRAELRAHLVARGLDWIEDPANADLRFARARARAALAVSPLADRDRRPQRPTVMRPDAGVTSAGWGVLTAERARLADRAPLLSAALLCAAGTDRPPRGEQLDRLNTRLKSGDAFTATLAGARLEADGDTVRLYRDAGEAVRGGLAPLNLEPGRPAVWDGRFEITADRPCQVLPLKGLAARLTARERAEVSALPAAARAGLPVLVAPGQAPTLASHARSLAPARLRAALGQVTHERQIIGAGTAEAGLVLLR